MFPQSNIRNRENVWIKAACVILFIVFNNLNTKKYF